MPRWLQVNLIACALISVQDIAPQSDATKQDVPSSAPMMEPLPTMSMKSIGPDLAPMPMALKMAPAPSHPYEKARTSQLPQSTVQNG